MKHLKSKHIFYNVVAVGCTTAFKDDKHLKKVNEKKGERQCLKALAKSNGIISYFCADGGFFREWSSSVIWVLPLFLRPNNVVGSMPSIWNFELRPKVTRQQKCRENKALPITSRNS